MTWSKVQICNMALGQAGVTKFITTLEDTPTVELPPEQQLCMLYWDLCFEAAGRSHPWGCLSKRADLSAATATAPAWGYSYAYHLPADYLGWLRFEDPDVAYRVVGKTVQTDETTVTVQYVARTEDTTLFDPLFVEALVMRLAAMLVAALQGEGALDRAEKLRLWHEGVTAAQAKFADSAEQGDETLESTEWIESRQ